MNTKTTKASETKAPEQKIETKALEQDNSPAAIIGDGFGFNPIVSGGDHEGDRLPRSMASDNKLKYVSGPGWTANGVPCNGRALIAWDKTNCIIRWNDDNMPAEIIPVPRGTNAVDLASLNAKVPRAQWRVGLNGQPEAPYQLQRVIEFIDPTSMERLSWPANVTVVGSSRASEELEGRIIAARRLHGGVVYPLTRLEERHMPTAYGGRQRPHLEVVDWVRLTDRGIERVSAMQNEAAAITDATK